MCSIYRGWATVFFKRDARISKSLLNDAALYRMDSKRESIKTCHILMKRRWFQWYTFDSPCGSWDGVFARVWWAKRASHLNKRLTSDWEPSFWCAQLAAVKATLLTSHWAPGKSWWEIDCEPCSGLAGCPSVIISWAAARGPQLTAEFKCSSITNYWTARYTHVSCLLATMGVWNSGRMFAS